MLCLIYLLLPFAQAANTIQWINPAAGTALTPGQSVEAKWTSSQPIQNPTFSLCTSDARCGQSTPAKIIDNPDGTTSALLSLPKMEGGSGMFLQMSDKAGGAIHNSPTFKLSAAPPPAKTLAEHSGEINERVPAPRKDENGDAGSDAESDAGGADAETSYNPYKWDDEATAIATSSGPTPTDVDAAQSLLSAAAGSVTSGMAFPTSLDPSMLPAAYRSQWPFSNPYAATNMTSSASSSATASVSAVESNTDDHARPNAAIIAVPLSICGAILLASLLFCARSRMRRQKDLETGAGGPRGPPPDWQAAVKRKALDTVVEKGPEGVSSVTVTERRDDAIVPILGYAQPPPRSRRYLPPRDDHFYDDPYTRYEPHDRGSRHLMDERRDSYGYTGGRSLLSSHSGSRCLTPMRERSHDHYSARRMGDYARSAESRHYDDRGTQSRSGYTSRGSKDRWEDEYETRHRPGWRDNYYAPSRRTRSGLGGMNERDCDCSSCHSVPLRNCTDCRQEESMSTRSRPRTPLGDPMRDLPGPTYSRPLPEPMIRTHTSSMSERTSRYRHEEYTSKSKHCEPPHRSGVLRRADSGRSDTTEAGWELAGKGAYETSHGRGMGGLYESLRRAIGESEPPRNR